MSIVCVTMDEIMSAVTRQRLNLDECLVLVDAGTVSRGGHRLQAYTVSPTKHRVGSSIPNELPWSVGLHLDGHADEIAEAICRDFVRRAPNPAWKVKPKVVPTSDAATHPSVVGVA